MDLSGIAPSSVIATTSAGEERKENHEEKMMRLMEEKTRGYREEAALSSDDESSDSLDRTIRIHRTIEINKATIKPTRDIRTLQTITRMVIRVTKAISNLRDRVVIGASGIFTTAHSPERANHPHAGLSMR